MRPAELYKVRIDILDRSVAEDLLHFLERFGNFHLSIFVETPTSIDVNPYIVGWIPQVMRDRFDYEIKGLYGSWVNVEFSLPEHDDKPPSLIRRSRFLEPFGKIVDSFGFPSYNEIDPTLFVMLSFALLFGVMFGDIGHGLILLASGLILHLIREKIDIGSDLIRYIFSGSTLYIVCGLSSILSGMLFGEFLGYKVDVLNFKLVIPYPFNISLPFKPLDNPIAMFKLSILIGAIHVLSGIILNLANKILNREYREALIEPAPWICMYIGVVYNLFCFKLDFTAWMSSPTLYPLVILPTCVMLLGKLYTERLEGLIQFFEAMISTVSNTVSYLRIMALSLSHSILTHIILELGGGSLTAALIGAVLVVILEGLMIFIHTTRLIWVEWFSKFYRGDGIPFKPLKISEVKAMHIEAISIPRRG
ncbi:MAG: V-type ATPase 116kDa subunit family protein [Candidatus Bathyarchaeia archaeon]